MKGSKIHTNVYNVSENGSWTANLGVNGTQVYLYSDDFTHDVSLTVTGNFYDIQHKLEYARAIAERMNKMPP